MSEPTDERDEESIEPERARQEAIDEFLREQTQTAPDGFAFVIEALEMLEAAKRAKHDGARTLTKDELLRIERSCADDLYRAITVSRGVRLFDPVTWSEVSAVPKDDGFLHLLVRLDELRSLARELDLAPATDDASESMNPTSRTADQWRLKPLGRADDLRRALHTYLAAADKTAAPPTASAVVSAWMADRPSGITRATANEVTYLDSRGVETPVSLDAVAERIQRCIERVE